MLTTKNYVLILHINSSHWNRLIIKCFCDTYISNKQKKIITRDRNYSTVHRDLKRINFEMYNRIFGE